MARMASRVTEAFDAAAAVTLRDITDGAETGADTDAENGVALNTLTAAYWDNDEVPNGIVALNVNVTDLDEADTDETYTLIWEVDTSDSFGSAVEVARLVVPATGVYKVLVDSSLIEALEPGATHLRVKCTKAGTTPSITYGCWATYKGV